MDFICYKIFSFICAVISTFFVVVKKFYFLSSSSCLYNITHFVVVVDRLFCYIHSFYLGFHFIFVASRDFIVWLTSHILDQRSNQPCLHLVWCGFVVFCVFFSLFTLLLIFLAVSFLPCFLYNLFFFSYIFFYLPILRSTRLHVFFIRRRGRKKTF